MAKSKEENDKIAAMLLEQYDLKDELYSLMKGVILINDISVQYIDGEIVTRQEWRKRCERSLEILEFVNKRAKKTILIEGKITLTEEG